MKFVRRRAQRTLRSVRINLRNVQKASAETEKAYSCQARRYVYRPILCNFEYGDAADQFSEDEWENIGIGGTI